jgi:hypothetical protein
MKVTKGTIHQEEIVLNMHAASISAPYYIKKINTTGLKNTYRLQHSDSGRLQYPYHQ